MPETLRILFIGDVVGSTGREVVEGLLPKLREQEQPDFVVINGENAAGGVGITPKVANALFKAGADAITLGNHAYRHKDVYEMLDNDERIIRPANYPKAAPGKGHTVVERGGKRLGVVNLSGQVGLEAAGLRRSAPDRERWNAPASACSAGPLATAARRR